MRFRLEASGPVGLDRKVVRPLAVDCQAPGPERRVRRTPVQTRYPGAETSRPDAGSAIGRARKPRDSIRATLLRASIGASSALGTWQLLYDSAVPRGDIDW